jgi:hypothetical protein
MKARIMPSLYRDVIEKIPSLCHAVGAHKVGVILLDEFAESKSYFDYSQSTY